MAIAVSLPHDLRAICYAQTIDAYLDGANKISYGSAALNENATTHGIYSRTTGQVTHDNWACYPRTASLYDAELDAC